MGMRFILLCSLLIVCRSSCLAVSPSILIKDYLLVPPTPDVNSASFINSSSILFLFCYTSTDILDGDR